MSFLSFLDISLDTANRFYTWGWKASLVGAAITLIGVSLLMWGTRVRDHDFEAGMAQLNIEAAKANERAAQLENDAAHAKLEVEKLKKQVGPRQLNREAFQKALEGQPKAPVQILYLRDDPDSMEFAQEIENSLKAANWTVISREPIPTRSAARPGPEIPIAMSVGGQPSGVTVVAHSVSEKEAEATWNSVIGKDWVKTPWTVLSNAFSRSMGESKGSGNQTCPEGILRVVVGPRR